MKDQKGNILLFIMLAIGLFATLSYVMVKSGADSNENLVSQKELEIGIYEALRYGTTLETAIQNMIVANNVSDTEISFENTFEATNYNNPNCTTDTCRVFELAGGGVTWRAPPRAIENSASTTGYVFSGASPIFGHGQDAANAGSSDLFMSLNVSAAACELIGILTDVPFSVSTGPNDEFLNTAFQGTYSYTAANQIDHADLNGEKVFCFEDTTDATYYLVYVLYPR